jgi:hypothetical protein
MLREDLKKGDAYKRQQEINNQLGIDDSLPAKLEGSVQEHLEKYPQDFLWPMYKMSKVLEEKKKKRVAILPLTTGFVPGACLQLDTQALVKLLGTTDPEVQAYLQANKERLATRPKPKRQRLRRNTEEEAMKVKDKLWNSLFEVDKVAARGRVRNNLIRFGHHITTDGVSVSATLYHAASGKNTP